jgi:two-component system response regulator MtrA
LASGGALGVASEGWRAVATIVVGEDDPDLRVVLSLLLSSAGHRAVTVDSGVKALALAAGPDVDLLVLDVALPGDLDGLDVVRRLRADPGVGFRPVMLISAHVAEVDLERGLDAGADAYLTKPFGPDEFLECIDELLVAAHI